MALNAKLVPFVKSHIFLVILLINFSQCQYYLSKKACGTLFSQPNFGGQQLPLLDRDQSISLHNDERAESGNWTETKSIEIQSSCSMELCNETYFDGACQTLTHGKHAVLNLTLNDIASASCTCEKECKCEDIFMKKLTCARAYLEGGCRSCHALYVDIEQTTKIPDKNLPVVFPEAYTNKVTALKLRKGCTLTYYEGESEEEDAEMIEDRETVENFKGKIGSYRCDCNDNLFQPRVKPPPPDNYPPLIDIPASMDDVIKMLMQEKYSTHPGLRAAHQSLKAGRSSKNVYIMLLGSTGSGKSSAINLLFDNANVTKVGGNQSTTTDIHEFRIPVPIEELGIANSELRVIDTPGLGDTRGIEQDAKFLATLESYLSSHEELKNKIPNIVLIFHKFHDNRFNGPGSAFVQMLRGLDSFRTKITDESYTNVVFVLSHFCSETKKVKRRPEARLAAFKETIEEFSQFPRPTLITVAENRPRENELPMVNGYAKLPNNEYYPRNLFDKLILVSEKGQDPVGRGVVTKAFSDSEDFNITSTTFSLTSRSDRTTFYLGIISNAIMGVVKTEISQLLKHTWVEKVDPAIRRKHPESLPYLQKALNMRNINTMADVPRTSSEILKLLTSVKHDEATRVLIEKALGITAPNFPYDTVAGNGYNVFKDTYLPTSPFVMGDLELSDIGYMIPKSLSCNIAPSTKEYFQIFSEKVDYVQERLKSLGISGSIDNDKFLGHRKPGHNIKSISFKNDGCSITASRELRLFEFELNDRLYLTPEFQQTVKTLPIFNESDHETSVVWNKFFDDYGTHVVRSVYGGGAIQIKLKSNRPYDHQISQALFDLIKFAEEMTFLIVHENEEGSDNNGTTRGVISPGINHVLKFIGGDATYHTTDLTKMSIENAARLLTNWKNSLKYHPSVLTTELRLVPISQVAKKLGQNYSAEIERAASLHFNSSLKYIPIKRQSPEGGPTGYPQTRDNTLLETLLKQQAESSQMMQNMMMEIQKMEAERQLRQQQMEEKRLQWEMEQKEKDMQWKREQAEAQRKSEAERRKWEAKLAEDRRRQEEDKRQRDEDYQRELMIIQQENAKRTQDMFQAIANRPVTVVKEDTGCLKPGTRILMADGSEKPVEDLVAGDLILDMELMPTMVQGVNYHQYLTGLKFFGFDNHSHFFTNEHMFVGPNDGVTNEAQFYVQSRQSLLRSNPLLKYWDVKEFSDDGPYVTLFYKSNASAFVEHKSVKVFQDPEDYPGDTRIYFLQVDSPTGTYFANGYVCKVDLPPVERWPSTMSLLFSAMNTPGFKKLAARELSPDTVLLVSDMIDNLEEIVEQVLMTRDLEDEELKGQKYDRITLDEVNMEECLHGIFNDPTVALISLRLYGQLSEKMSVRLDDENVDPTRVAQMQHALLKIIAAELDKYSAY